MALKLRPSDYSLTAEVFRVRASRRGLTGLALIHFIDYISSEIGAPQLPHLTR